MVSSKLELLPSGLSRALSPGACLYNGNFRSTPSILGEGLRECLANQPFLATDPSPSTGDSARAGDFASTLLTARFFSVGTFSYIAGFVLVVAGILSLLFVSPCLGRIIPQARVDTPYLQAVFFMRKLKMISTSGSSGQVGGPPPMAGPIGPPPGPGYDDF